MRKRLLRTAIYFCVEGSDEKIFLKHLITLYSRGNTSPKIESANGGDPLSSLEIAIKRTQGIEFTHKVLWIDTDVQWPDELEVRAKENNIILIGSSPCLEGILFQLLGDDPKPYGKNGSKCKKDFQRAYLNKESSLSQKHCEKLFGKKKINIGKKKIKELNLIINILLNESFNEQ